MEALIKKSRRGAGRAHATHMSIPSTVVDNPIFNLVTAKTLSAKSAIVGIVDAKLVTAQSLDVKNVVAQRIKVTAELEAPALRLGDRAIITEETFKDVAIAKKRLDALEIQLQLLPTVISYLQEMGATITLTGSGGVAIEPPTMLA